ncbi:hypothetical protein ES703_119610 [subsurface metagenome]
MVVMKYVVVGTLGGNLEKQFPRLVTDGYLTPACLATYEHCFLFDVVLEKRADLASPHTVVRYQGQYRLVPQVIHRL